jgi:hypothetical protein
MSAKLLPIAAAAMCLAGCADAVKRFAPPGIVKYEDLAKGEPVDPAIVARIKDRRAAGDATFPNLSEQPRETPEGMAKPDRVAMEALLTERRDTANGAIAGDRVAAPADRQAPLEEAQATLLDAIETDREAAARDRALSTVPQP